MMKSRRRRRTVARARVLHDPTRSYSDFGDGGSCIWDGSLGTVGSESTIRCHSVGFGGGIKNAMAKSPSCEGDEGVTMMAGKGDFSSTKGLEMSNREAGSSANPCEKTRGTWDCRTLTKRRRNQSVVQTLRQAVKTRGWCGDIVSSRSQIVNARPLHTTRATHFPDANQEMKPKKRRFYVAC